MDRRGGILAAAIVSLALSACQEAIAPVTIARTFSAMSLNGVPLPVALPSGGRYVDSLVAADYTFVSGSTVRIRWRTRTLDRQTGATSTGDVEYEKTYRQSGGSLTIFAGICLALAGISCIDDQGVVSASAITLRLRADTARTLHLAPRR